MNNLEANKLQARRHGYHEIASGVYLCRASEAGDTFDSEEITLTGYYIHTDDGQIVGNDMSDDDILSVLNAI